MRDIWPADKLRWVLNTCGAVFQRYGFRELNTPAVEGFDLLSAKGGLGEAVRDEIYNFKDKGNRELGLRFDLTMPLVRFVVSNPQLPKPFKRYAIGKVWRYDNPQAMRYREFWQADVDIIGSSSLIADIECLSCAIEALLALGIEDFYIRVNDRRVIEDIVKSHVSADRVSDAFRSIDKLDKIGLSGVRNELERKNINPDIMKFITFQGNPDQIIKNIPKEANTDNLKEFFSFAKQAGIDKKLKLDLSLVRGLDYYSGFVFEIMIKGANVSCGGGGHYDNLIKNLGGPDLPAVGISLGIDRILNLLEDREPDIRRFYIAPVKPELSKQALDIAKRLRMAGFFVDIDLMSRSLSKQFEYASSIGVTFVIIVGQKELERNSVKIRDLRSGIEKEITLNKLEDEISSL